MLFCNDIIVNKTIFCSFFPTTQIFYIITKPWLFIVCYSQPYINVAISEFGLSMLFLLYHYMFVEVMWYLHENKWFGIQYNAFYDPLLCLQQDLVFKKDKATLHVIPKRCEDTINHSN